MDEGRIVAWHKREGDVVAAGDVLFEVETDKATMEVESPTAGTLRRILLDADAAAPVATVVALITETPEEPLPDLAGVEAHPPKPSQRDGVPPARGVPRSRSLLHPSKMVIELMVIEFAPLRPRASVRRNSASTSRT